MSEKYILELEEEVERLHEALQQVAQQLELNWNESLTVGLVPELHYKTLKNQMRKPNRKKWKSLRLLREYILGQYNSGNIVHLRLFDAGDGRQKIYNDVSIVDSDDNPITYYILEHYIENK